MGRLALRDMIDYVGPERALDWHLRYNTYPPVHPSFTKVIKKSIDLAKEGMWDEMVNFKSGNTMSVESVMESLHLHEFLYETSDYDEESLYS